MFGLLGFKYLYYLDFFKGKNMRVRVYREFVVVFYGLSVIICGSCFMLI